MTPEQFIKAQIVTYAHQEGAIHGGIDNMLAVAFVLRNRRNAGWFGGDWLEIISHAADSAGTYHPPRIPNLRDINVRMLLQQVDDIYSGMAVDKMTQGALFYCELASIQNDWFKKNVLSDLTAHERVATVGLVSFFR
jgi:hypothetical protein